MLLRYDSIAEELGPVLNQEGGPEPTDPGTGDDDDVTKTTTDKPAPDVNLDS